MPPKKKINLVKGQLQLRISTSNLELLGNSDHSNGHESHDTEYPESSLSLSMSATTNSSAGSSSESSSHRRGTTTSWRSFGESKWRRIHPWLLLKPDGVYCQYCCHCHREVRSRSGVLVTKPYTGNRPDKLSRLGSCSTHLVFHTEEDGDNDWIYIYLCFNYLSEPVFLKKECYKRVTMDV